MVGETRLAQRKAFGEGRRKRKGRVRTVIMQTSREPEDDTGQPQLCYSVTEGLQVQPSRAVSGKPHGKKTYLVMA